MVKISSPLRIVLVENNENERVLFREAFQNSDVSFDITECAQAEEALELLDADASSFDVAAIAYNLPGISGTDLCRKLLDNKTPLPLVLLTEMGTERLTAEALKAGVHDYVIKDPQRGYLELLPLSLTNAARRYEDYHSHKKTRQALWNTEQMTEAFLDAIPDSILLTDTEGNVLNINKKGAERIGRSPDDIIGANVRELFPRDVYELRRSKGLEVIRTGKMLSLEDERDGIFFETWICPVFDAQGEVKRLAVFAHDITGRRQAEKDLRDSKYLLEKTFNSLDRAVLVLDNRIPPRIIDCNPATIEIFGYPKSQMIGQTTDILHVNPVSLLEFQKQLYQTIETKGHLSSFEFMMKRIDGRIFPTEHSVHPLTNDTGERIGWVSIVSDITERKKAENALIQSEEKFRLAMEVTNDALWDWNLVTNEVYRNPRHATMLGYQPHELTASQEEWEKRIHPDDRQAVFQILEKHLAGTKESFEIEYRLRTKSGDYIWILGRGKVVTYSKDGSPTRMIGTNIDITDRKKQRDRDEIILKTSIDGFWIIDVNGRILEVNDAYCRMTGYSRDELLTMSVQDMEAVEAPHETLQHIQGIMEIGYHRFQSRQKRKDGKILDLDISANYLELDGGRVFTFFRDITATKQAEKEIRKFKTIADKAGHGVAIADLQGNLVYVNDSFAQMHLYSKEELMGKHLNIFHNAQQMERVKQLNEQLKEQGNYLAEEVWHKKRNDTVFPTLMSATLVKDEKGEPLFMAGTAIDITKHKKAEEALQESELRYRTLFETLQVGVGLAALDGQIIDANSIMLEMMDFSFQEIKKLNVKDLYHNPEERTQLIRKLQQDGFVRDFEAELKRRDGSSFYTSLNVTAMKIREETVLVTVARDITEKRHMERALAESEEKYRTLIEGAGDPIFTIDEKGVFLFANKQAEEDFQDLPDSLVGKTLWDLFPKEIADRKAANVRKVISTGRGMNITSLTEVQGKHRWYNITIEPLRDERGNVNAAMIIARDVDDMKRAEEQIKKLSSAVEQSIDGIAIGALGNKLLYVNDSYAHMHGYTADEMVGMKVTKVYPANKAHVYEEATHQTRKLGAWRYEVEHVRKDGSTFPAYLSVALLKDDKGDAVGYIAVCRDMTEYKRTQEILDIKNAALESSINGIVIGDIDGNLTYVNNSFLEMWGYDNQSEVLARNAAEFWDASNNLKEIKEAMYSGEGWIGELTGTRKDGSKFDIQVCQTTIRDENGKIISLMGSFVDISESKKREEELTKYREQMARAEQLASLGTLSATVAHQLTQPLTVIRLSMDNALDELQATSSSETVIRRLKDSVTQVSNITSIVERFRNFARKSSGRTVAEVDMKAVAVRIARLLAESARSAGITLRLRNMGNLPCPWMNETDLEQLFFALIENAIQAANGKKDRQLVISGDVKHDHIELSFSDNCGGISAENIDKIFEPFFTTKPRGQGTGLGLCIVQDVVSRTGGHVRVENKYGKGATFIISLPIDQGKIL